MTDQEFAQTYLPLSGNIYRVAFYILESEEDAQDVTQDVFVKLLCSRDTLDAVHNPKAYCISITRNMCLDRLRADSLRKEPTTSEDTAPPPDSLMQQRERLKTVARAIEQLPKAQRMVLQMRVMEDRSYEQISEASGMNSLTLRVLLSQARKKLRKLI